MTELRAKTGKGRTWKDLLLPLLQQPAHEQRHYFCVDLLRGIAAVAILFCHYQYFYGPHSSAEFTFQHANRQPLYSVFWPLYLHGQEAVELFWVISGFIFSAVYVGRSPSARSFFVHRFSRLYPLHFITLMLMVAVQTWSHRALGYFQIYGYNDLYHFILNLLFVCGWGFEKGVSFNFPIWSVSVELVIYCAFFVSLPVLFRKGVLGPLAAAILFFVLNRLHLPTPVPVCGLYFFVGCCVFVFLKNCRSLAAPAGIALVALLLLLVFGLHGKLLVADRHILLFAGTILILGHIDETYELEPIKRGLAWIAENTYSVYLLGIPLQFALMCALDVANVDRSLVADSTWFLVSYLALVFVLARLSFLHIERPAQVLLRRWMLPEAVIRTGVAEA